ncbi:MAG TPA: PDZ domain-containing protein [Casimicrobiaceae bacterium]|nr:PDZ domain-containing protein [Casimicrobiaceae bacterium]
MARSGGQSVPLSRRVVRDYVLPVESGVRVDSLEAGAPAARSLAVGDVIVAIDASPVRSIDDLQRLLGVEAIGQVIAIQVIRGAQQLTRDVTPVDAAMR